MMRGERYQSVGAVHPCSPRLLNRRDRSCFRQFLKTTTVTLYFLYVKQTKELFDALRPSLNWEVAFFDGLARVHSKNLQVPRVCGTLGFLSISSPGNVPVLLSPDA
jgi:hypothetical protein